MSMKLSQLRTHWSADDAHLIISFLDELKDVLWATYGADIVEQRQRESQHADSQGDRNAGLNIDRENDF